MTNLELRIKGCEKLIGRPVEVEKLGAYRPETRTDWDGIYVPLPEYGIALWCRHESRPAPPRGLRGGI